MSFLRLFFFPQFLSNDHLLVSGDLITLTQLIYVCHLSSLDHMPWMVPNLMDGVEGTGRV